MNRCTKENCPMNAETLNPDCDLKSCPYRTEISGDLISREETLNKINDLIAEYIPLMPIGWTLPLNIAKTINELPSITPQQNKSEIPTGWIPCSERLPEKEGKYLVTTYSCGTYEVVTSWFFIWDDGEIEWGEYGVVAWMPRIEPYVSDKNDGDIEESEGTE